MARKQDRRPQVSKRRRSAEDVQRVLGLRSSNAAVRIPSGTEYRRSPKHRNEGWE
jgi:hypothetical protein